MDHKDLRYRTTSLKLVPVCVFEPQVQKPHCTFNIWNSVGGKKKIKVAFKQMNIYAKEELCNVFIVITQLQLL